MFHQALDKILTWPSPDILSLQVRIKVLPISTNKGNLWWQYLLATNATKGKKIGIVLKNNYSCSERERLFFCSNQRASPSLLNVSNSTRRQPTSIGPLRISEGFTGYQTNQLFVLLWQDHFNWKNINNPVNLVGSVNFKQSKKIYATLFLHHY